MTVHGYEIDPHDPDYLTINPLEKKLNNENR
jgi:hypothetical protein